MTAAPACPAKVHDEGRTRPALEAADEVLPARDAPKAANDVDLGLGQVARLLAGESIWPELGRNSTSSPTASAR
ncbi:hypothetical protein [Paenarthrobacter sp. NEAU-H11]|uniref:hypothetical protein n=1 Tax=Paenarthrobacter sp. NEAU-H11 TaxID=3423924 RepID=UPI003D32A2ED